MKKLLVILPILVISFMFFSFSKKHKNSETQQIIKSYSKVNAASNHIELNDLEYCYVNSR